MAWKPWLHDGYFITTSENLCSRRLCPLPAEKSKNNFIIFKLIVKIIVSYENKNLNKITTHQILQMDQKQVENKMNSDENKCNCGATHGMHTVNCPVNNFDSHSLLDKIAKISMMVSLYCYSAEHEVEIADQFVKNEKEKMKKKIVPKYNKVPKKTRKNNQKIMKKDFRSYR